MHKRTNTRSLRINDHNQVVSIHNLSKVATSGSHVAFNGKESTCQTLITCDHFSIKGTMQISVNDDTFIGDN